MGKSLSSVPKVNQVAKIVSSSKPSNKQHLRKSELRLTTPSKPSFLQVDSPAAAMDGQNRVALAHVVSDCVKRWFQETLKEAKGGDINMQVLVGQMYNTGYGVPQDPDLGRAWINRASRSRSSALKVSEKPPGYNASDSDSDAPEDDKK